MRNCRERGLCAIFLGVGIILAKILPMSVIVFVSALADHSAWTDLDAKTLRLGGTLYEDCDSACTENAGWFTEKSIPNSVRKGSIAGCGT